MSIKLKITGGLGNQMFQFAAGYSVAKSKKVDLNLDLSWYKRRDIHNGFELQKIFDIFNRVDFLNKPFSLKQLFSKIDFRYKTFEEPHFHYTPEILNLQNHCFLRGYWQSEMYFTNYASDIRKIFEFKKILDNENSKIASEIIENKSVSLHIRRGDFLKKNNQVHQVDLTKFYNKAINEMSNNFDNPKFFIFSDDPKWVFKNFSIKKNFRIVSNNKSNYSYLDMYLMSLCKCNILANSTFSWWSAWLNNYSNKIILAPKTWFTDKTIKTDNLFPKNWDTI